MGKVLLVVSGQQKDGTFVTHDAVRTAFAALGRVNSVVLRADVAEVSGFELQTFADGRVAISGEVHEVDGTGHQAMRHALGVDGNGDAG